MVIKIIQFVKYSLLFILTGLLTGCVQTLKINGKKHFYLSEETAEVRFTGEYDKRSHYFIKIKSEKGDIEVDPNGLKLIYIPSVVDSESGRIYFIYKKRELKEIFHVKQGETFVCRLSAYRNSQAFQSGIVINEIHVLPGDFITHNGKSLIMDTIKIKVRH